MEKSRQYPLLYWTTLINLAGVPNFVHFDVTGRTHTAGIINPTSVGQIAISIVSAYVLLMTVMLNRQPLLCRKIRLDLWLLIPLLLQFTLATLLQPASRLIAFSPTDKIVGLYRLGEWVIAFALLAALYSRTPAKQSTALIVQLIGRVSWIWMAIVWLVLPIMPRQAYGASGELASAVSQLGGQLIEPSYLATLAIAAFFYALFFFPKGILRLFGCLLATATIVLAHTRIEQFSFLLLLLLCALFFSGKLTRLTTVVSMLMILPVIVISRDYLVGYFARGQRMETLLRLNDRTLVWQASLEAAKLRPFLGYGFVAGAKDAIRDHWIYLNWTPPHAHNEYIQALLSGGILCLLIVLGIYGRLLWMAIRSAASSRQHTLLLLLLVLFLVRSIGGSNFTIGYNRVGALFLLVFIGITAGAKDAIVRNLHSFGQSSRRDIRERVA